MPTGGVRHLSPDATHPGGVRHLAPDAPHPGEVRHQTPERRSGIVHGGLSTSG